MGNISAGLRTRLNLGYFLPISLNRFGQAYAVGGSIFFARPVLAPSDLQHGSRPHKKCVLRYEPSAEKTCDITIEGVPCTIILAISTPQQSSL